MTNELPVKVSVIIPCYNVEKYLRECLDSVVNQTLKEIEIICVDDGSTDSTPQILEEYAAKDSRFTILHQKNQFAGVARNNGMKIARGKYLCFLDSDDFFELAMFEKMVRRAEEVNADIVVCDFWNFFGGTPEKNWIWKVGSPKIALRTQALFSAETELVDFSVERFSFTPWNKLFKREFVMSIGNTFSETRSSNDVAFVSFALYMSSRTAILPEALLSYRRAIKGAISATRGKFLETNVVAWKDLKSRMCAASIYEKFKNSFLYALAGSVSYELKQNPSIRFLGMIYNEFPELPNDFRVKIEQVFLSNELKFTGDFIQRGNLTTPPLNQKPKSPEVKVSVIIPVYNVESYLRRCLDSVRAQTLKEIEIICVNDGSTDGSAEILQDYANLDSRIKIVSQPNQGQASARNIGMRLAKGIYIGFVDSDDYVNCRMYETLFDEAQKINADVVECSAIVEDMGGAEASSISSQQRSFDFVEWQMDVPVRKFFTEQRFHAVLWNKIYNRRFLEELDLSFDGHLRKGEDAIFQWKVMPFVRKFRRIENKFYHYCFGRVGSVETVRDPQKTWLEFIEGSASLRDFWNDRGLMDRQGDVLIWRLWNIAKWRLKYCFGGNISGGVFCEKMRDVVSLFPALKSKDLLRVLTAQLAPIDVKLLTHLSQSSFRIVVSLTSFPARIKTVYLTIETLLSQTWKADRIVLWLADSQFPQKEGDLPEELLALRDRGLEIRWCEDLKSYKKLIPALKAFPDAVLVTVDDDLILEPTWLEELVSSYLKAPNCIHTHRAHEISFNSAGDLAPYAMWKKEIKLERASFNNFLTGGGGCLYPPNCLHGDVLDIEKFQKLCPHGDDIWFWAMAVLAGTKICVTPSVFRLKHPDGTQEVGLWKTVNVHGENDRALRRVLEAYPQILPKLERIYIPKPADKNTGRETSSTLREKPCSSVVASTPECSKKLPRLLVRLGAMFIWNKAARKRWRERHMDLTPKNGIDIHAHPELRRDSALKRFAVRFAALFIFSKSKRKAFRAKHLNLVPRDGIDVNLRGRAKSDSALKRFGVRVVSLFIFSKKKRKAFRARHMDLTPKNGVDVNALSPEERRLRKQKKRERNPLRRLFNAVVPASRSKVAHTEKRIIRHMEWQTQQILSAIKGAQAQSERRFNELKQEIARAQKGLSANIKTELDQVRERADVVSREQLARMDAQKKFFAERAEMLSRELDGLSSALTAGLSSQTAAVSNLASAQKALRASVIESYAALEKCKPNSLEFRTFGDLAHCIRTNLHKLPADADLVVGVPRSGMIPAYTIALFMNKRCCSLDEFLSDTEISTGARPVGAMSIRKVLVVDDSCFSGSALARTKERLKAVAGKYEFVFAAVYGRTESADKLDCCLELVDGRRVWQWNYLNHSLAGSACFDMDGVLCADPTPEENDDGAKYLNFIKNAKPLYIPSYKIRAIVTSRLEKYREPTETWLREHGVQYDELVMLNMATAEERRRANCHAAFKAEAYKARERTTLFVESEERQAKEIAFLSGKDVLCVATDKLY